MTPLAWALASMIAIVVLSHCAVVVAIGRCRDSES